MCVGECKRARQGTCKNGVRAIDIAWRQCALCLKLFSQRAKGISTRFCSKSCELSAKTNCDRHHLRKWNESPFQFKISRETAAVMTGKVTERKTAACKECGSVKILGSKAQETFEKRGYVFCDEDCACLWKRRYYRTSVYEHNAKRKAESLRKKKISETNRLQRWRSCGWCWNVFCYKSKSSIYCSKACSYQAMLAKYVLERMRNADWSLAICRECNGEIPKHKGRRPNGFCSKRCGMKSVRRNQRHKRRSRERFGCNINIGVLMRKSKSKCAKCGVKCHLPTGKHSETQASIDHIVPLAKGGWHVWSNVQLLC
ncbi:MAG: hypothetical protein EBR82_68130, partial [Caulobacteraceae bacterium]|nr:hypothetical protein [Caulobacteraceae bacterium]